MRGRYHNRQEMLERRKAVVLTLYVNKGWQSCSEVAAYLKVKPVTLATLLKRMAQCGELETKTEMVRASGQVKQRYLYKLSNKTRRYWSQQMRLSDG
jgi:Mn-dependent DtxR family transcriptional regulator